MTREVAEQQGAERKGVVRSYRQRQKLGRQERRERSLQRIAVAAPGTDPSDKPRRRTELVWLLVSFGLHAIVVLIARFAPATHEARASTPLEVEFVEPEPPKVAPLPPPPPVKVAQRTAPVVQPIEKPPEPPKPEPPPAAVRRVVGLNLESTVTGGAGEGFAVGNTRMGETAAVAEDADAVQALHAELIPPRRVTEPEPEYPPTLRAKGVEGDVGLEIEVDSSGHVGRVEVTEPSPFDAFNVAALSAAKQGIYEPAKRNGEPLAQVIHFKMRFRLRKIGNH